MSEIDPLDALLNSALAEQYHKRTKGTPAKGKTPAGLKPIRPEKRFADPENWRRVRAVSLIHTETNTVIGTFEEFLHKTFPARKLIRVEGPSETDGTEWVSGPLWVRPETEEAAKAERWSETREAICGITIPEMGVHCPDAHVQVRLQFSGIARVELADATRFTCPARNTFLILPKGCDVLGVMSLDSKLVLRSELGLDKPEAEDPDETV